MPGTDDIEAWLLCPAPVEGMQAAGVEPATGGGRYRAGEIALQNDPVASRPDLRDGNRR